jgi:hypothetical protein
MRSRKSFMEIIKTPKPKIKLITEREVTVASVVKPIINLVGVTNESKVKKNDEKSKEKEK